MYAAVSSSAIAMATGAAAAALSSGVGVTPEPIASVRSARQAGSSGNPPFLREAVLAIARQGAGRGFLNGARAAIETVAQTSAPSITSPGVVPIYGLSNIIEPGEWVSIYGQNLAAQPASWNGDFPTSLGGTSVTIDGKPAYLSYVSPTQINLQAPDDTALGTVSVVVTTATGSATSSVTLSRYAPSFSLLYQNSWRVSSSGPTAPAGMAEEPTISSARPGICSAIRRCRAGGRCSRAFRRRLRANHSRRCPPGSRFQAQRRGQPHHAHHQ